MELRRGVTRRNRAAGRPLADAAARAVIECAADAIIAVGADRAVTVWNPAAEALFGWTAAEVLGAEAPFVPAELIDRKSTRLNSSHSLSSRMPSSA